MSIFNYDSPIFNFLGRLADLCLLNIIYLITCLPIVTFGAATTALYTVTLRMARKSDGYLVRSYFKAFKDNFKISTIIWVPSLLIFLLLLLDIRIINVSLTNLSPLLVGAYILIFLLIYMLTFVFPYIARFENTVKATIKNALLISAAKLPFALLVLIITYGLPFILLMLPKNINYLHLIWLLLGSSLTALISSYLFEFKIFKPFISEEDS